MDGVFRSAIHTDPSRSKACWPKAARPFLSIVTRTQGRRPHTLVEVLTCLAAQSDIDFEMLLLGHCLDTDRSALVLGLVDDCPLWLRDRIRYIDVKDGTRTRPLTVALKVARGEYVAVLDDDDVIFAHWVENFRKSAAAMPGRVLRSNTVVQVVDTVAIHGVLGLRAEASPEVQFPKTFNFLDHILQNRSPPITLAFPRQLIEREGISFDETLTTTEDWDFLVRCASVLGVADASEITSIYRWWNRGESSRTLHLSAEWEENHYRIWKNWDSAGLWMPPGSPQQLVKLLQEHAAFKAELLLQQQFGTTLYLDHELFRRDSERRLTQAKLRANNILNSTSWRATRPLRQIIQLFTGRQEDETDWLQCATVDQAEAFVSDLYHSRCWRLAAPLRFVKRLADWLRPRPVTPR